MCVLALRDASELDPKVARARTRNLRSGSGCFSGLLPLSILPLGDGKRETETEKEREGEM